MTYQFHTLGELREWLNQFQSTDLGAICVETRERDYITLTWKVEALSDGSEVTTVELS
jgi:hypothetical protein